MRISIKLVTLIRAGVAVQGPPQYINVYCNWPATPSTWVKKKHIAARLVVANLQGALHVISVTRICVRNDDIHPPYLTFERTGVERTKMDT